MCFKLLKFTLKYTINAPTCFGLTKPLSGSLKSVGAFIVYFNVNFNILKKIGCALVGLIKDWITSECAAQLWKKREVISVMLSLE
jgi:hypothetical protein